MSTQDLAPRQMIEPETVLGWGVDADTDNDPTYPLRDRTADDSNRMDWVRPTQQNPTVEVLQSIEHNRLPAVVGTSTPPSGLSGTIRRAAFRRSESDWMHWLMLLGADRVNAVEGLLQDLGKGQIPNIPAERGIRSAWQHDRQGVLTKAVVITGLSALAVALIARRANARRDKYRY